MRPTIALRAAALATAALLPALFAGAETATTTAELAVRDKVAGYIYSKPMLVELSRLGQEQDEKLGLEYRCKEADSVTPLNASVVSPIDLPDGAANPVKGAWMLRYVFKRCGMEKIYNAVFVADQQGGTPTIQSYYPGSTRAGPALIKNAMPSALAAAESRFEDKACKNVGVFDMRVTAEPPAGAAGGAWWEAWIFRACGKLVEVPLGFVPNAARGGTDFFIDGPRGRDTKSK